MNENEIADYVKNKTEREGCTFRIPCKPGDILYSVSDYDRRNFKQLKNDYFVDTHIVFEIRYSNNYYAYNKNPNWSDSDYIEINCINSRLTCRLEDVGIRVFLTSKEAFEYGERVYKNKTN